VLRAIADPHRREILGLVLDEERSAGEIAAHFEITRPAVSQHLAVLRQAGLVRERREGNRRLYQACPEALADVRSFIEGFWTDHLRRLKAAAEHESRRE
jgi:DNA-binding transcriptional ArsR family regulator